MNHLGLMLDVDNDDNMRCRSNSGFLKRYRTSSRVSSPPTFGLFGFLIKELKKIIYFMFNKIWHYIFSSAVDFPLSVRRTLNLAQYEKKNCFQTYLVFNTNYFA
ncbi:hypothetical protein H5410_023124 [Solanum commersonii]|uniref:Uncharacterized protein n=1 Tax=Solanum commersonii TaxID=4109 RepID=A0A9J5ZFY8_SOLCO|nr:hypothetical protein H5410_023124 [Solanum commersonii]